MRSILARTQFYTLRTIGAFAWAWTALGVPAAVAAPPSKSPAPLRFNQEVRPILSEHCFSCHGPDSASRMAGLRLDRREDALARKAFAPGKPEKSAAIERIFAKQPSRLMPPPAARKPLSAAQKETLKRWVSEGALYEKHWALNPPPKQVPLPAVKNAAWVRTPIDRFVLAKLEQTGLKPSPEASRTDWLRRVTFDLIGLPPTPQETKAFLADASKNAYEKVADRLLASPRYGERMALPWLDVARYADSYGYQSDQMSPTWRYRDWAVWAFNSNLSYDKFVTWQLAGDLLPNPTREQRLATAFNRLHRMTNEGGSVPEEWRMEGIADRVRTFGTAFLGLALECARCHDHKYDPISQKDYYSLSAFFNSIDEHGLYDQTGIVPSPSMLLPTPEQEKRLNDTREALSKREEALRKVKNERDAEFRQWLAAPQTPALPDMTGRFDFERFEGATLKNLVQGAKDNGARQDEVPLVEGKFGKAILLDGENNVNFPALGRFTRHTPYSIAFWMRDPRLLKEPLVVFQACSGTDSGPFGYDLMLEKGVLTARMYRHYPGNAIAVRAKQTLPQDAWTHVAVTYDGSSRASGLKIYVEGKLASLEIVRDKMLKGSGQHTLIFGQRFRDRGFKGGRIDELAIFNRAITPLEVAHLFDGASLANALKNPRQNADALREYYLSAIDPEARKALQELTTARAEAVAAEDAPDEVAIMEEMPKPRPAYVLARGRYDAPQNESNRVGRGALEALSPFPKRAPLDRLGLAQWLLAPENPLTARVQVNRLWAVLFGRGIVETAEDFGVQGRLPTHPELLDWLARDFVQSGWDIKALLKKLVLSSVYRQSSALTPELLKRDPQNYLLARAPSYRLSAETIRDLALAASGLMDDKMGGAPVSPYQPGDLWRESNSMSPAYRQSVGGDLYRRSLYTVWKRTAPMPNMLAFDAGSREVCIARRQNTNTPLQAFVLLNDPQFVEASRVLGERILKEGGATDAEKLRFAFQLLATREPLASETRLLAGLLTEQRALFQKDPAQAKRLLTVGERKPDPTADPIELAAATVLAQTILNLDATIWKR